MPFSAVPLSDSDVTISPVKPKLPVAPSGFVCFSMMILPRFVFVNVQVTSSSGSTLIVAVAVPTSVVLGVELCPSSQTMLDRSQPAGMFVSVTR